MKTIDAFFDDFLSEIRLTARQREDLISGHKTLRDRLHSYDGLKEIVVTTFLQGSYRRSTAVRPQGAKRADVDVIVVTNLDKNKVTPQQAIDKFVPFVEKYYKGKYALQGRSIGIELSYVDLDIVITSAPSEVEQKLLKSEAFAADRTLDDLSTGLNNWNTIGGWRESDLLKAFGVRALNEAQHKEAEWKLEPLHIPDRDAGKWEDTHPLEQINWTWGKNKNTSGHYINVVKALKWWRILRLTDLKYPKGYPIEHMIGDCCPDGVSGMAEGVCLTLENIVSKYRLDYPLGTVPTLPDRGVPSHNVWKRISAADFKAFYEHAKNYAKIAREALNAKDMKTQAEKWKELFGDKFPDPPPGDGGSGNKSANPAPVPGGFTKREAVTTPAAGRFA